MYVWYKICFQLFQGVLTSIVAFCLSCSGDLKQVPNGREARVTRERRSVFASSLPPLTFEEAKDLRLLREPQA